MIAQPSLTQPEWALILELLERERYELPAEIHHTRTTDVREELRRRMETVDSLLARLRRATSGAAA